MKKHMLLFFGLIALINIFHFAFQKSEKEVLVTDENGQLIKLDSIENQKPAIKLFTKTLLSSR
ncbi:hypothetical protein [Flexithrix dorotheae]|uniref:hypothetical protein n=1 Tax=Flexithrix dorotheae TaxID=70993 RepID=UPI00037AC7AD|nr:hypothetical protein [Flexithrix dorotheae]